MFPYCSLVLRAVETSKCVGISPTNFNRNVGSGPKSKRPGWQPTSSQELGECSLTLLDGHTSMVVRARTAPNLVALHLPFSLDLNHAA